MSIGRYNSTKRLSRNVRSSPGGRKILSKGKRGDRVGRDPGARLAYPVGQRSPENFPLGLRSVPRESQARDRVKRALLERVFLKGFQGFSRTKAFLGVQDQRQSWLSQGAQPVSSEQVLCLRETRADRLLARAGLAASPEQARQWMTRGLVQWGGAGLWESVPSGNLLVKPGRSVQLKPEFWLAGGSKGTRASWVGWKSLEASEVSVEGSTSCLEASGGRNVPRYLEVDWLGGSTTLLYKPRSKDLLLPGGFCLGRFKTRK